ncbi:helix-turn-helix transcriptional regulator [Lysinibacillus macroides]|uniref:helix-turn-helix domain-containing protein n=1 Tax=Lysinibacillus macroides TaxID=33935 RepID=UPI0006B469C0|nr:helix-turn-helix transcriptional regulator [Lysinibacillus macroides]QPR69619.1 helix-turn-helix transcriptional regulator [Lysinibacillus macroides]
MIGLTIARLRKGKKMSQEELGHLVGIEQTLISRIERNQRKVKTDELSSFAKALGVPITELLEDEAKNVI